MKNILFFVLALIFCTAVVFGNSPVKVPYKIPKVKDAIKTDGKLDDPIWKDAVVVEAKYEVYPGENIPAPVKTEALLAYNDTHLFVGFRAFDPDPGKIRAHLTDRDKLWSDDWVLILFDTFNDNRRTYDFACNPLGVQADIIESPNGGDESWDTIWDSHGRITEWGYTVEMAIPFNSFGFQRSMENQIWGFDVVRSYPRNVRHHIGTFPRDRSNNCYMCQAEKLIGFRGVQPGRNLELAPTLSALSTKVSSSGLSRSSLDPGLTARWGFTPNMTMQATLNPDFSQVEADVVQMDVNTRFALYYPEKRPFFIEGSDLFRTPFQAVYTRTLANPRGGVKLTGKEGANTIGFFSVQDEITNLLIPGTHGSKNTTIESRNVSSVLRYKRDIGTSSNIGVLLTDREGDHYCNRLGGIDGLLKFTSKDQLRVQVMSSGTQYPDSVRKEYNQKVGTLSGHAYSAFYQHDTRNYHFYGLYRKVSPDFRADLGFMAQSGFHYSEIGGSIKWQKQPGHWYTWLSLYASYDQERDVHYRYLHKAYTGRFNYEGPLQSLLAIYGENGKNVYKGKTYRSNFVQIFTGMQPSGMLNIGFSGRFGDQIDYNNNQAGRISCINPSVEIKMGRHLSVSLDYTREKLKVKGGELYHADIGRCHLVYQFTRRLFVRTILQFHTVNRTTALYADDDINSSDRNMFGQFLFSYKINPQTMLFLGYSGDAAAENAHPLTRNNRTFFVKLGYAWQV